jgi:hypothetical protein
VVSPIKLIGVSIWVSAFTLKPLEENFEMS